MHVNGHTLVKCTYGKEALRDEAIHGMNSRVLVPGKGRFDFKIIIKKRSMLINKQVMIQYVRQTLWDVEYFT